MCNEIAINLFKNVLLKDISNKQCFHNRRMSLYCFYVPEGDILLAYYWHIVASVTRLAVWLTALCGRICPAVRKLQGLH